MCARRAFPDPLSFPHGLAREEEEVWARRPGRGERSRAPPPCPGAGGRARPSEQPALSGRFLRERFPGGSDRDDGRGHVGPADPEADLLAPPRGSQRRCSSPWYSRGPRGRGPERSEGSPGPPPAWPFSFPRHIGHPSRPGPRVHSVHRQWEAVGASPGPRGGEPPRCECIFLTSSLSSPCLSGPNAFLNQPFPRCPVSGFSQTAPPPILKDLFPGQPAAYTFGRPIIHHLSAYTSFMLPAIYYPSPLLLSL